ncbi:hypothetical protein ANN_13460 [Periplaneta americana]|uniref:Uncharacterized protein n=1 Tax=Periplaneta americana TaxID=6978 RepID=A0ABQ8TLN8_PERAM|nr:hypothetical protein ANN_13460 [Periplaneta americana]
MRDVWVFVLCPKYRDFQCFIGKGKWGTILFVGSGIKSSSPRLNWEKVKIKMADLQSKLEHVEKTIGKAYPMYSALLKKRKLKYNGTFCPVDPMKTCPTDQRNLQTVYRFTIDVKPGDFVDVDSALTVEKEVIEDDIVSSIMQEEGSGSESDESVCSDNDRISEIGQYGIGFFGKKIKSISSTNLSCPEHVIEAANVFEKMLQVPVEPTAIFSRWKKLIIHTNRAKDLMVTVFGKCPKEVETEELKRSHDVLKEYYTNGDGKEYEDDNASKMSPGSSAESFPAFTQWVEGKPQKNPQPSNLFQPGFEPGPACFTVRSANCTP